MPEKKATTSEVKANRKQARTRQQQIWTDNPGLDTVHSDAAGIDVGNSEHYVAIAPEKTNEPVQRFGCFTRDLRKLATFLKAHGIAQSQCSQPVSIGFLCMTSSNRKVLRCIW
jgi:hypothetical protein